MDNKKWKVLIVDDEYRIAMLIQKLIHWDEMNMECVAAVDNGVVALELLAETEVDIVITDIRMPVVSGFDIINKAETLGKDVHFIVVSGYKEFEYAHKALQHGVTEYLLKPINEGELNRVLSNIGEKIRKKEEKDLKQIEMEDAVSKSRRIINREFLNNIIEEKNSVLEETEDVCLRGDYYRGIDIKLDYVDYKIHDLRQDKITLDRVCVLTERMLGAVSEEVMICVKDNMNIYCMLNYDSSKSKDVKNSINDILNAIKAYLIGFEQYEVTIGIGGEKKRIGDMRFSITEATNAVENRIHLGAGRLIYSEMIRKEDSEQETNYVEQNRKNIYLSIEKFSRDTLEQTINQIYSDYMLHQHHDYSSCYKMAEKLISIFFEKLSTQIPENSQDKTRLIGMCHHCYSLIQLKQLLKTELGNYLEQEKASAEAESAKPIRRAKQYIEENFGEKITLEDMADIVELNPVYFSVLFKNETGMNFSTYLVDVRMAKAKEMLCNTNETIAAIGQLVGYKDSRYFSQLFTKYVGVKPVLYRKLHS